VDFIQLSEGPWDAFFALCGTAATSSCCWGIRSLGFGDFFRIAARTATAATSCWWIGWLRIIGFVKHSLISLRLLGVEPGGSTVTDKTSEYQVWQSTF
jgi:hypothetical protein